MSYLKPIKNVILFSLMALPSVTKAAPSEILYLNELESKLADQNFEAVLGAAYQSDKEKFIGGRCFNVNDKNTEAAGKADSTFSLKNELSKSEAASELGFGFDTSLRFAVTKVSAASSFLKQSVSDKLSVSSVWESNYLFPVKKLMATSDDLNSTGKKFNDRSEWADFCGDQYVNEIIRGAKLFFSIRIDFSSQETKQAFDSKFSISGSFGDASATLKQASAEFSKNTKVTISGYQIGGNVERITALFPQTENGMKGFTQCTMGDFEKCADVLAKALDYASNVSTGFPSQLSPESQPGPAVIGYRLASYNAAGIKVRNYPELKLATKQTRARLSSAFEKQFAYMITVDRILKSAYLGERRQKLMNEQDKIDQNIKTILDLADVCYSIPDSCFESVSKGLKTIVEIDETVFIPESFNTLCSMNTPSPLLKNSIRILAKAMALNDGSSCEEIEREILNRKEIEIEGKSDITDRLDLRIFSPFRHISTLSIKKSQITDVTPLSEIDNLKHLDLQDNRIQDVSPLSALTDLTYLNLSENFITDVSDLAGMIRLQWLLLSRNKISDLKNLMNLPSLGSVSLSLNPLNPEKVNEFKKMMPSTCEIKF